MPLASTKAAKPLSLSDSHCSPAYPGALILLCVRRPLLFFSTLEQLSLSFCRSHTRNTPLPTLPLLSTPLRQMHTCAHHATTSTVPSHSVIPITHPLTHPPAVVRDHRHHHHKFCFPRRTRSNRSTASSFSQLSLIFSSPTALRLVVSVLAPAPAPPA
jgi:hypothetical protein